jgi:hypothetical protein
MTKLSTFLNKLSIKKIILKLDELFIGRRGFKLYSKILDKKLASYRNNDIRHGFYTEYKKNDHSLVNKLCDKYGSDKGEVDNQNNPYVWDSHNYADIYDLLFRLRRDDVKLVLECGLGTNNPEIYSSMGIDGKPGASLRLWRDYFKNAKVVGCDIDERVLFNEDRIETYACDQTDSSSIENFINKANILTESIDIVIDDGLHEFHAGISFFESIIDYLSQNGLYIIEDVNPPCLIKYKDYFSELSDEFTAHYFNLTRPNLNVGGNRLIVISKNPNQ